jgi:hypothetical protein
MAAIAVQFDFTLILPYVTINKNAFPHNPAARCRLHQIILPAKTSTGVSRELSSAIQAFVRFAVSSGAALKSHRA